MMHLACSKCGTAHNIGYLPKNQALTVVTEDGQEDNIFLAAGTVFVKVGKTCYFPHLTKGDLVMDGHTETLREFWEDHGLPLADFDIQPTRKN